MISMLKTCLGILLTLPLLLMPGCVTVTPEQMASADYGTFPSPSYREDIKKNMEGLLFDPRSAQYRFIGEPERGYAYLSGRLRPPTFGYVVHTGINAKNGMGKYVGEKPYRFFIRNGTVWSLNGFAKAAIVP